jgi:hypothetical protein
LIQAEALRRQGDLTASRKALERAAEWTLHSGSVEHLCLWHLYSARVALDDDKPQLALPHVEDGIHMSRGCGFGLSYVELLNARSKILLTLNKLDAAVQSAREAWAHARSDECKFAWGLAEAGHRLGQALEAQGDHSAARDAYDATLKLRRRIHDFRRDETENALARLPR